MTTRAALSLMVLAACGSSYSESAPSGDAGADGATPGACDPSVLYVSSSGDDRNDGCDSAKPRKTVTSAIGFAIARNGGRAEIRTCAETLRERVVVGSPTSIVGGFDCSSWAPGAGRTTFEAPSPDVVETVIVFGPNVTAETKLEHLRIVGPKRSSGDVAALRFTGGAAPTVRHVEVEGGTTESGHAISVGIEASSPIIEDTRIAGGRGTCTSACSATYATGISIAGGHPRLSRLRVEGGTAHVTSKESVTASIGAIAIDVQGDVKIGGADSWSDLEIVGGLGHVGGVFPVMGVRALPGTDVQLLRPIIRPHPTPSTCDTSPCFTIAAVAAGGTLRLARAVVTSFPAQPGAGASTAVTVRENSALAIEGGHLEGRSSAFHARTGGIDVLDGASVDIAASTIVGAELVNNTGGTAEIRSSILAQTNATVPAFHLTSCPLVSKTILDTSVVLGSPASFARFFVNTNDGCSDGGSFATLAATVGASTARATFEAKGVRRRTLSCAGEEAATCVDVKACDPASPTFRDSCLATLFASPSNPAKLSDVVPCEVSKGGLVVLGAEEDLDGSERTPPASMGALEHDGTCTP